MVVRTPRRTRALLRTLRRNRRAKAEFEGWSTTSTTVSELIRSVRSPSGVRRPIHPGSVLRHTEVSRNFVQCEQSILCVSRASRSCDCDLPCACVLRSSDSRRAGKHTVLDAAPVWTEIVRRPTTDQPRLTPPWSVQPRPVYAGRVRSLRDARTSGPGRTSSRFRGTRASCPPSSRRSPTRAGRADVRA